jgi:hypothetical protein
VSLVGDWNAIERELPDDWAAARLVLTIADDADCGRAAALLGPANPGRSAKTVRFSAGRRGVGVSPDLVRRLLRRLDEEGIRGDLQLVDAAPAEPPAADPMRLSLVAQWDAALAALPPDWSDVQAELQLRSARWFEPVALALSPLNPSATKSPPGFRFRVARNFGYGTSAEMTRRALERVDEQGVPGEVRVLRALSDTRPVYTQGPVWRVGGRAV